MILYYEKKNNGIQFASCAVHIIAFALFLHGHAYTSVSQLRNKYLQADPQWGFKGAKELYLQCKHWQQA